MSEKLQTAPMHVQVTEILTLLSTTVRVPQCIGRTTRMLGHMNNLERARAMRDAVNGAQRQLST